MIKKTTINERILYIVENQYNGNQKKFAESIGFAAQVVFNIVSGRKSKPSFDVIEAIISTNDHINIDWLLTGNGDMLKSSIKNLNLAEQSEVQLPLIPIEAMAGYGTGETQILELDCEYFSIPTFKGADFLITVKGSSMYPKYNSGDIVACKKLLLNDVFFQWNKVYVMDTEQGALIKRICKSDLEDHVKIVSDNLSYEPFDLHLKKIRSIAIVIGVIRLE